MIVLPEDTTLEVVDDLIAEAEERRTEQVALIEHLTRQGQATAESERVLAEIERVLAALQCRRSYLRAMQVRP
ncbi:hypothetical protein [Methylobacterium soli]|uniref:Uncharacterized protein n=1 Tax=Methylobacterium soli TaxID=553447 RepID=A0A6L3SWW7_9HYPH|nr:hypothetical protein [Methylobacterium soli]KAB1076650.1 hypothetical protein F6X53_22395 [Methylobacterium soli]GJE45608.1 hypothetical protein AEGHOMDF_4808 [Methylobacterium soli]